MAWSMITFIQLNIWQGKKDEDANNYNNYKQNRFHPLPHHRVDVATVYENAHIPLMAL